MHLFTKTLMGIGALLFASGCETITPMQASSGMTQSLMTEFADVQNFGIIVFNGIAEGKVAYDDSCSSYGLEIVNLDKPDIESFTSAYDPNYESSYPTSHPVVPGNYVILSGSCTVFGYTGGELSSLSLWFQPFEVKAGEILYMGTLKMKMIDVKSRNNAFQTLMNFRTTEEHKYPAFSFEDYSEEVLPRLQTRYLQANINLVERMPKANLTEEQFENIILQAYQKNEDGKYPTVKEAKQKIGDGLRKHNEETGTFDQVQERFRQALEKLKLSSPEE